MNEQLFIIDLNEQLFIIADSGHLNEYSFMYEQLNEYCIHSIVHSRASMNDKQ